MKKIKVLFLVGNLRPSNGVSSFVMTYFRNINHRKFSVDFALLNDIETPYYDEIRKLGGKIFILPSLRKINKHIKACKKILDNNNYQIIHDNLLLPSIPMMFFASKKKIPVRILQSHNTKLSSSKWKEKRNRFFLPFLKKFSNTYCACGIEAGKSLFGNSSFKVVPNAISVSNVYFSPQIRENLRRKFDKENKIVIGTVGRISMQKNPFFALDVINRVHNINPDIEYWWIGSGELENKVKKYAEKEEMLSYIKFFGSRNDVRKLYQAMDIFFLPSLFEGLPITAVEAQAAGLPCVISDSVTKEVVYTDLVNFISLNSSLNEWANKLLKQVGREEHREKYMNELRRSQFYSPNAGKALMSYYSKLLDNC